MNLKNNPNFYNGNFLQQLNYMSLISLMQGGMNGMENLPGNIQSPMFLNNMGINGVNGLNGVNTGNMNLFPYPLQPGVVTSPSTQKSTPKNITNNYNIINDNFFAPRSKEELESFIYRFQIRGNN